MPGLSAITCPSPSLAPKATQICTATYTTTQADRRPGQHLERRYRERNPSDRTAGAGHVGGDRSGDRDAVHRAVQDGQPAHLRCVGHHDHLQLCGHQQRQRDLEWDHRHRPHGRPVRHHLPDHHACSRCVRDVYGHLSHHPGGRRPRPGRQHGVRQGHRCPGRERDRSRHGHRSRHPDARYPAGKDRQRRQFLGRQHRDRLQLSGHQHGQRHTPRPRRV